MKILLTGASSFTGTAFAEALAGSGHAVTAPMQRGEGDYAGVRGDRVARLKGHVDLRWSTPFGGPAFLDLAARGGFDLLCHHAAHVENYRSPDFDVVGALSSNVQGLRPTLEALKSGGLRGVVLTGSVFEADEGLGEPPLRAFSPYGLSKTLTAQVFGHWCPALDLPLGKFVIPNPFGPFEEPRFCAYLYRTWKTGEVARVNTPDYIRDNIHVDLLAACYARFAAEVAEGRGAARCSPSGYVESQGGFSRRMAVELAPRLGLACGLDLATQTDFSEPMMRVNAQRAAGLVPGWDEAAAWDRYATYLRGL